MASRVENVTDYECNLSSGVLIAMYKSNGILMK